MARKGRSRKVTRRRKLRGGVNEKEHYRTLVDEYHAVPLVEVETDKKYKAYKMEEVIRDIKYNAYKMNDKGEVQDLGRVTITGNGRGAGAYDTINFKDDDDNTYTSDHGDNTYYMSEDGYFFTEISGGSRKRKLKRSTRRKHL